MDIIRYARIFLAVYTIVVAVLLYKKRKYGIDIMIATYGVNILLFYAEYYFKVGEYTAKQLNVWSSILGLHAIALLAFYCTSKLVLLRGIDRAHKDAHKG